VDAYKKIEERNNIIENIERAKKILTDKNELRRFISMQNQKIKKHQFTTGEQQSIQEYEQNQKKIDECTGRKIYDTKNSVILLQEKEYDEKTGLDKWKTYATLPGYKMQVWGRKMHYLLKNKNGETTLVSWGRLYHLQQKYPDMPFLEKFSGLKEERIDKNTGKTYIHTHGIKEDLQKHMIPVTQFEKKERYEKIKEDTSQQYVWVRPSDGSLVHRYTFVGGGKKIETAKWDSKQKSFYTIDGEKLGEPLNETEITLYREKYYEGPGTEPVIASVKSVTAKLHDDKKIMERNYNPTPETTALNDFYKKIYEKPELTAEEYYKNE